MPGSSQIVSGAITSYKDTLGPYMVMWKLGYLPARIKRDELLYTLRDVAFLNALEVDRTFNQGRTKSAAFRDYTEVALQAQSKIDETAAEEEQVVQDFYKHIHVTSTEFNPPDIETLENHRLEAGNEGTSRDPKQDAGGGSGEGSEGDNPQGIEGG